MDWREKMPLDCGDGVLTEACFYENVHIFSDWQTVPFALYVLLALKGGKCYDSSKVDAQHIIVVLNLQAGHWPVAIVTNVGSPAYLRMTH